MDDGRWIGGTHTRVVEMCDERADGGILRFAQGDNARGALRRFVGEEFVLQRADVERAEAFAGEELRGIVALAV